MVVGELMVKEVVVEPLLVVVEVSVRVHVLVVVSVVVAP